MVGNSSSAIRDGAFIGIPAVNVGKRQNSRLTSKNVIQSSNAMWDIYEKIKIQYGKKFKSSKLYGSGDTSKKILKILKKLKNLAHRKPLHINISISALKIKFINLIVLYLIVLFIPIKCSKKTFIKISKFCFI